jgi:hypothetical protein
MKSENTDAENTDDQRAPEESDGRHPQEQAAADLSKRAAESVGRRYDATKESVHETHGGPHGEDVDSGD